jgi:acyl dehydratase
MAAAGVAGTNRRKTMSLKELEIGMALGPSEIAWDGVQLANYALAMHASPRHYQDLDEGFDPVTFYGTYMCMEARRTMTTRLAELGLARHHVVQIGQYIEVVGALPTEGKAVTTGEIIDIKNGGEGEAVRVTTSFESRIGGELFCRTQNKINLAGRGWSEASQERHGDFHPLDARTSIPETDPTSVRVVQTDSTLGIRFAPWDENPHCRSQSAAEKAGLAFPPTQGLCVGGMLWCEAADALCGGSMAGLKSATMSTVGPVKAGDKLELRLWKVSDSEAFGQVFVAERDGAAHGKKAILAQFTLG